MKNPITSWKLEAAKLYAQQINQECEPREALDFAESCYENRGGDIENDDPQNVVDYEIDCMRADC